MSQTIDLALASLVSSQSSGYVVEDIYVKGGYRVVTVDPTTWNAANNDPDDGEYQSALADEAVSGTDGSLKIGCLVFDNTSGRNFRCTNLDPVTFVEVFANDGSIDESRFVQRTDLPQDANGAIDIASEATLQDALLSSVRVTPGAPGQSATVNLGAFEIAQDNPETPLIQISANPADPATSTPAQVNLIVNPFAAANAASA